MKDKFRYRINGLHARVLTEKRPANKVNIPKKKPRIVVYSLCRDERIILPYFLRHYLMFADKVIIYDNGSTDGSIDIIRSFKNTEVRSWETSSLDEIDMLQLKNNCYKEQIGKCDYVIVCDIDEFLFVPDFDRFLEYCNEAKPKVINTIGINMISDMIPDTKSNIFEQLRDGVLEDLYSKTIMFSPEIDINFGTGCHTNRLNGANTALDYCTIVPLLLHYRYLGIEYVLNRNAIQANRLSERNKRYGFGVHLSVTRETLLGYFNKREIDIIGKHYRRITMPDKIEKPQISYRFWARYKGWEGFVILYSDGNFVGGAVKPNGTWMMENNILTLKWHHWGTEELFNNGPGFINHQMMLFPISLEEVLTRIQSRSQIPLILSAFNLSVICEVGVHKGDNFKNFLTSRPMLAVAVDLWRETGIRSQNDSSSNQTELDKMYQNIIDLANNSNNITVVRSSSLDAANKFEDEFFDLVYIDADHTYDAVYSDIRTWFKKVKKGGIIAGHDYVQLVVNGVEFGVVKAVHKFVKENNQRLFIDRDSINNWYIIKS